MPADRAMHGRKDRLSGHAILGCAPPPDEAKVGATLVRLLLEAASGAWSFASLAPDALPRDARDGIPRWVTLQSRPPYRRRSGAALYGLEGS